MNEYLAGKRRIIEGGFTVAMGRPPKPTAIKELHGNPGKRPLNKSEPKPEAVSPEAPHFLSPEARAEWDRVVPQLEKLGLLAEVDRAALTVYCEAWSTFEIATKQLRLEGPVITGRDGGHVRNPLTFIIKDAVATLKAYSTEFGLTPSARGRMSVPGTASEEDEHEAQILSILS